jgi:hypothetical protein
VGAGGKTLRGQQRFQVFEEVFLIFFDRQQIVSAAFINDLLHRFHLGVGGIGQHDFIHQVQLGQLLAPRWDFITALFDQR